MRLLSIVSGLPGLKLLFNQNVSPRGSGEGDASVAEQLFEHRTVAVSCQSRFIGCYFISCEFLWAGKTAGWRAEVFVNCIFDDCDFGMSIADFLKFTRSALIDPGSRPRLTHRQAIDEAVSRLCRDYPLLAELSLDPANSRARRQAAGWVRAEFQKIMAEHDDISLSPLHHIGHDGSPDDVLTSNTVSFAA